MTGLGRGTRVMKALTSGRAFIRVASSGIVGVDARGRIRRGSFRSWTGATVHRWVRNAASR